jgi:phage terminase large subunit-like protein
MPIINPILQESFDNDLYFPPSLPDEITSSDLYRRAVDEGWHEWIETPLDFEAMKRNYYFDLSRDVNGDPIYWIDGGWQLQDGTRIPIEDEEDYVGHVGKADYFMRFAEGFLRHTKNEIAGQPYRLLPWMRKICATLFGWVHRKSGYRRYQEMYIAVAKKNAKSSLMSVIAIFCMYAEQVPKAYVYCCACDRNQARIIYDEAASYVKAAPELSEVIGIIDSRARMVHEASGSYYVVLSADHHRNDGIDSYCTLIDEIHRHKNRKLYAVMKRAGRARSQKLLAVITTYGPSLSDGSVWAEVHQEAKAQMEGRRPNSWQNLVFIASAEPIPVVLSKSAVAGQTRINVTRLQQPVDAGPVDFDLSAFEASEQEFGHVTDNHKVSVTISAPAKRYQTYLDVEPLTRDLPAFSEATANLDWRSDHAIRRANPAVGQIFPIEEIRKDIESSRSPSAEAETKQLSLNIVSGSGRKWLSDAAWQALSKLQVQPKKLIGRFCYGGFDGSFGGDLTAFSLAFPSWDRDVNIADVTNPRIDLLTWAWLPNANIEAREEAENMPYRYYAAQSYLIDGKGSVRITDGSVLNFPEVCEDLIDICRLFEIRAIAYDPVFASFVIPRLESEGLTCVAHSQTKVAMAPACKRFAEFVYNGWLAHGDNPVLTRAVEGAQLRPPDDVGNTCLTKSKSVTRIDPLQAAVMAVGFTCAPPDDTSGAWSSPSAGSFG